MEYDASKDTSLKSIDGFEPLSRPKEEYLEFPKDVTIHWIGNELDVDKLDLLKNEEYIGIDSEWRPQLTQYLKTKPSLLQISGEKNAYLIDLVALQKSDVLDKKLSEIFRSNSVIIGFGFSADIDQFA